MNHQVGCTLQAAWEHVVGLSYFFSRRFDDVQSPDVLVMQLFTCSYLLGGFKLGTWGTVEDVVS